MAQRFAPTDPLAMDSGTAQVSALPQPALPGPSQLTTAEMDVLIGVQRSIPRPPPGHVAQHVNSRQVTRQTTQGSTSITETFTEVIVDLWTEVEPSQGDGATRQATQVDPMSEAHWTEATDPWGGEMYQQVPHSSARRCQRSRYRNVTSQRSTRRTRTDDQLSSVEMEILTGGDSPQYRGQYRSVPALPESQPLPGYPPCSSMHHSLPSIDSSLGMDTQRRSQNMSFQTGPGSTHVTQSNQTLDPNLQIVMDALSRDDKPRYQQENMPVCLPTRPTTRSYNANQSDELALVPLGPFLGSDSSQQREQNRFSQHQFGPSEQIDLTGSTPEQIDPLMGDHTRRSTDRYQPSQFNRPPPSHPISTAPINTSSIDASQFSRPPPSYPISSAPTNISTGIDASQFSRPPPSYSISSVPTNSSTGIDASQFSRPPPSYPASSASPNISTITGASQFNRPPPYYSFSSAPVNISTHIESPCHSTPSTRTRTVQMPKPMPYPSTFERNPSTRVPARNQSQYASAPHPTHIRTPQANRLETFLPTTIKVEPQEQEECQYASSQISPQLGPSDVFNPSAFSQLPTAMGASVAETRSQYIPEPLGRSAQTSHANLSDPTDPFSLAEMDIFTGVETSRYQGQFISAPLLAEHQTQQSNLPNPLTYPFLGATMDTPEVQIAGQVSQENISSPPFSEYNLIKIELNDQSTTIDSSLVIDLDENSNDMPYQSFNIPTPPLPEASPQTLQSDLPNLNAYPSLAAAIDALAEMEIAGRQNQYEPGHRPSRANMLATSDYTSGSGVEIPQLQSFNPMSNQFNRDSTSSSLGMPLHPSPNIRTPARPPESERQRVARLLREFLKNSSK